MYPDEEGDIDLKLAARIFGKFILWGCALFLFFLILIGFIYYPITMLIGAVSLTIITLTLWVIYKICTESHLINNPYYHYEYLIELYKRRRCIRRKRIEESLDNFFRYTFDINNYNSLVINSSSDLCDRLGDLVLDYYSYKPKEARTVLVKRNEMLIVFLKTALKRIDSYEAVINILAHIEKSYKDSLRIKAKDIYDTFVSDVYNLLLPIAEKISAGISMGSEFSFDIALNDNTEGNVYVSQFALNNEELKLCATKDSVPYRNIPDFDNPDFKGFMPLATKNKQFYRVATKTVGANLLKYILTQQRNRVSPSGPSLEIITIIDNTFNEIAKDRWEQDRRRHEEDMDWIRESSMLLYD